jgi:divalent metal cation (Fe/Co/Zn/Cd) transporter
MKNLQESLGKHSTPLTRKYFFKNENAADRVTILGVWINIVLSVGKFFGGIGMSCILSSDDLHQLTFVML